MIVNKRKPAYRIQTARTVVRCWQPSDAPLLKEAIDASVEHLRPWMPWIANEPEDIAMKVERLRTFRGRFDLGQDFVYGIFDPTETRVLGGTGLHTRIGRNALEIGYWIRADRINQGIATEVSAALTHVAFVVHGVNRVEIHCDPRNLRSAAVPHKLGFTHEATLRGRIQDSDGAYRDSMIWTMFARDYPTCPSAPAAAGIRAFDVMGSPIR